MCRARDTALKEGRGVYQAVSLRYTKLLMGYNLTASASAVSLARHKGPAEGTRLGPKLSFLKRPA